MLKLVNFLRGSVLLEVTGAYPERFLNLCAISGVGFWGINWMDSNTLRVKVSRRDARRTPGLAAQVQCEWRAVRAAGLPAFLLGFRRRYALLIGLAVCLAAVCVLANFVLTIEVAGNERVSTSEILSQLHRHGVKVGVFGPGLDARQIAHEVLLDIEELSWMSVNLHGTRAEVLVRERDPKPEIADEKTPANVVADAAGIIVKIDAMAGQATVDVGATVVPGDVLISGAVDLKEPSYSTIDLGIMLVRARGVVTARTWRTLTAQLPLEGTVKEYTGREKSYTSLSVLGHRLNFYGNTGIPYDKYDKIRTSSVLTMPGGRAMPLSLTRETVREYEHVPHALDATAGEALLKQRLQERLHALVVDGQIVRVDYAVSVGDDMLTVTLLAECMEQIGRIELIQ